MTFVVVSMKDESYWRSCCFITAGLRDAYRILAPKHQVEEVFVSSQFAEQDAESLAVQILSFQPQVVCFLDTYPEFGPVIGFIRRMRRGSQMPLLRFHAYGDFTCKAALWLSWKDILIDLRTQFVCASEAQEGLLAGLLVGSKGATGVCHFPLDIESFSYSPESRSKMRRSLGLDSEDFVILYTGRMTLQKNVIAAVRAFANLPEAVLVRCHFVFAGEFDDLGAPVDGANLPPGGFFTLWSREIASLPEAIKQKIHLLRGLPRQDLRGLYSAADVYLSLSLQHDEDFGMAPAEAALSGLPLLLTRWGGYKTFLSLDSVDRGITVSISETNGSTFKISDVVDQLLNLTGHRRAPEERIQAGLRAAEKLSVQNISKQIEGLPQTGAKFRGFRPELSELAKFLNPKTGSLAYPNFNKGSVYEHVYRTYVDVAETQQGFRIRNKFRSHLWYRKLERMYEGLFAAVW